MRDSQRKRVYTAENLAFPDDPKTAAPTFAKVEDVERYVKKVWASKRVRAAFPKATTLFKYPPSVIDGRGCRWATARGTHTICMPRWSRREWVILHELAHIIVEREYWVNPKMIASHGWQFCETFLKLVLYMMGREAHDALKAAFKAHRVKFKAPREKKQLSEDQRDALRLRLSAARELKKAA